MKYSYAVLTLVAAALFLIIPSFAPSGSAQSTRKIIVPEDSIERAEDAGVRAHTNVIGLVSPLTGLVSPATSQYCTNPYTGTPCETPASIACVYQMVTQVSGCPVNGTTNLPSGGYGAIAIVDAYDDPNAASDLDYFSKFFGLPAPNFSVVYASGSQPPEDPSGNGGWELEESLDIEWAHAMAPNATIYLVEAASTSNSDMFTAVQKANSLVSSVGGEVSMSWSQGEFSAEYTYDQYFQATGVVYFAATGDQAFARGYPAMSPYVVAAGGTIIDRNSSGAYTGEVYWDDSCGGGGGGVSQYESYPAWGYQADVKSIVGLFRGVPDVSSNAGGCTSPVAVYDSFGYYGEYGWIPTAGTSVSSPTLAGRANGAEGTWGGVMFKAMYDIYSRPSYYPAYFRDITQANSNCKVGWDICAGLGSPLTQGWVSEPPAGPASVSPTSLTLYGYQGCPGEPGEATLTNNGSTTVFIEKLTTGTNFPITETSCSYGTSLSLNQSCWVDVAYAGRAGREPGSLRISDTAGTQTVTLTGYSTGGCP
jgi:subtilase family serine protease